MSKIVDLLDQYNNFSTRDKQSLEIYFGGIDTDGLTLRNQSGSRGSGYIVSTGNVDITYESGIQMYHPATGEKSIWLDPDGDALFGWDTTDPAKTALAIFSNDQEYNSNDYGKGDLLVGDDSTAKANIWWDRSAGKLYFRNGTDVSGYIGGGDIVFESGTIGGWTIGATTLSATGIILDSGNEKIDVGVTNPIIIDGANENIRSDNFSGGAAGFSLYGDSGNAEFNNITARGTFKTSVFQKGNIIATGGRILVSKNASEVYTDVTTPATATSFAIDIKNDDEENVFAAVGDVIRVKGWNGAELIDVWLDLHTVDPFAGEFSRYWFYARAGYSKDIQKGMAAVNYGPTGSAFLELEAGDTATRMRIATHAASPWTTFTNVSVFGNLRDTYGAGANDYFGLGLGDYASDTYLTYNADGAGSLVLSMEDGGITLNSDGITLFDNADDLNYLTYRYSDGERIGDIAGDYNGSGLTQGMIFRATRDANSDWADVYAAIHLFDDENSIDSRFYGQTINASHTYGQWRVYQGSLSVDRGLNVGGWADVPTGEIHQTAGYLGISGRWEGDSLATGAAGGGVELGWVGGTTGRLLSYDRTAASRQPMGYDASTHVFSNGGTHNLTINTDVYSAAWTDYSATSTFAGWSSRTETRVWYKKVGKTLYVQFRVVGTANAAVTTFTLPYNGVTASFISTNLLIDGAGTQIGYFSINTSGLFTFKRGNGANPSSTGTKGVYGIVAYQVA